MTEIRYKTRKNSNPKGKARVYFTCHKEDFNEYFDAISDEILKKQNCAVYYYTPEDQVEEEDLLNNLSQMQLVVIPITTKFLCSNNSALEVEFKYAFEHHIPILPLMQENGLEELFNMVCGEIQTLNKGNIDSTAISYDEKLSKFLDTILISDELAEKIRSAFDAYIFLSYRKKDRKYAQQLMRLIHRNEFCRDIAIWYDEFLVPGENFNAAIELALKKSELFALLVTPNLVNEENYVMTIEYPMAQENGKKVLAVEGVETDKNQLTEKFHDVGVCVNIEDEGKLTQELLDKLHKIAIKENDTSPEHKFLIGLAYLSGIDVEVDHRRALSLITMAAEKKLPEAVEKLVQMYTFGETVERNLEKAIEWLTLLCEIREKNFSETQEYMDGVLVIESNEKLGDIYYEKNQLKNADEYYQKIYNMSVDLLDEEEESPSRFSEIIENKLLEEVSDDEFKKIVNYYKKDENEINEQKEMLRRTFLKSAYLLANIKMKLGAHESAIKSYDMTLYFIDKYTCGTSNKYDDIKYLCYIGLSDIFNEKGQWAKAFEYRKKSVNVISEVVKNDSSKENLEKYAEACDKFGDICYDNEKIERAEELYLKALHIREKQLEDNQKNKLLIARSYYNLSYCHVEEKANEYEYKSLKILFELAKANGPVKVYEELLYVVPKFCDTLMQDAREEKRKKEIIEKYYKVACVGFDKLSELPGTISSCRALLNFFTRFSSFFVEIRDYENALFHAQRALEYAKKLAQVLPNSQIAKEDEYIAFATVAEVYKCLNNVDDAVKNYKSAIQIVKEISMGDLDNGIQNTRIAYDYVRLHYSCGKILPSDEQIIYYACAYKIAILLCKHFPNNKEYEGIRKKIEDSVRKSKSENKS